VKVPARVWIAVVLIAACLAALPFALAYAGTAWVRIANFAILYMLLALGLKLVVGFAGLLDLGYVAFYGIGAYTSGLLTTKLGAPFPVALLASGLAASLASLLMVPITRLSGVYLAVSTIGFSILVHLVLMNEEWLTGGTFGLIGIPRVSLFGYTLRNPAYSYLLCVGCAFAVYAALARLERSRFGRAVNAIRQNEDAARSSGLPVTSLKSQCFVIAAFVAGLAGSLYAHQVRYLAPDDFTFWKSIEFLFMVVIGGVGSLFGAVLGAAFVVLLPEWLREIGDYRMLVFGALIVAAMLFGTRGLAGLVDAVARAARARRRSFTRPASKGEAHG